MNKLQVTKEKLINEYFDLQDKMEFAKDLAALCRASDCFTASSLKVETNEERQENDSVFFNEMDEQLLRDEVDFYSAFVDFVKKYAK